MHRLCLEVESLSGTAAPTAAAAARSARSVASGTPAVDIDIYAPCVAELALLHEPVGAVSRRVASLLADYPDHPVLQQLAAIATRLLGLSLHTPIKTALTGLELLLARAQVRLRV